jgi:hypothetical protein
MHGTRSAAPGGPGTGRRQRRYDTLRLRDRTDRHAAPCRSCGTWSGGRRGRPSARRPVGGNGQRMLSGRPKTVLQPGDLVGTVHELATSACFSGCRTRSTPSPGPPPHADGPGSVPVLMAMRGWGDSHVTPGGPPLRIFHDSCEPVSCQILVCGACGEAVAPRQVRAAPGPGRPAGLVLPGRTSAGSV